MLQVHSSIYSITQGEKKIKCRLSSPRSNFCVVVQGNKESVQFVVWSQNACHRDRRIPRSGHIPSALPSGERADRDRAKPNIFSLELRSQNSGVYTPNNVRKWSRCLCTVLNSPAKYSERFMLVDAFLLFLKSSSLSAARRNKHSGLRLDYDQLFALDLCDCMTLRRFTPTSAACMPLMIKGAAR